MVRDLVAWRRLLQTGGILKRDGIFLFAAALLQMGKTWSS